MILLLLSALKVASVNLSFSCFSYRNVIAVVIGDKLLRRYLEVLGDL